MKTRNFHKRSDLKKGKDMKKYDNLKTQNDEELTNEASAPLTVISLVSDALADLSNGMLRSDKATKTHTVKAYKVGHMIRIDILPKGD